MLLQLAVGEVADPDAFRGRLERWTPEVAPGAPGWLGSTGGVTPGGVAVVVTRFASAEAAAAASRRPESVAWWSSLTAACLAGPPTVVESEDVTVVEVRDAGHAGFVQLMRASVADRARFEALEEEMGPAFVALRPDFLAGYRAWLPDGTLAAVDWFRSESEAREGESREMPAALRDQFSEWMSLMGGPEWYDLRHPGRRRPPEVIGGRTGPGSSPAFTATSRKDGEAFRPPVSQHQRCAREHPGALRHLKPSEPRAARPAGSVRSAMRDGRLLGVRADSLDTPFRADRSRPQRPAQRAT